MTYADEALGVRPTSQLPFGFVCACLALLAASVLPATNAGAGGGSSPFAVNGASIGEVEDSLVHDGSYKVRVHAALVLGRLRQPRSVPALLAAVRDAHPAVRATAARSLGLIGGAGAREAVTAATRDPSPMVRRMAREALRRLGGSDDAQALPRGEPGIRARAPRRRPSFEVKAMGDPGHHAGPALQSHMRDFLVEQLRPFGDVSPAENQGTYAIDGVIKAMGLATTGTDVEVRCAVQLVVSRQPGGGVFLITTGEASVQKPRRAWRPQLRNGMEMEALEAAVRGASEDLARHLAPQ